MDGNFQKNVSKFGLTRILDLDWDEKIVGVITIYGTTTLRNNYPPEQLSSYSSTQFKKHYIYVIKNCEKFNVNN